MVIFNPKMILWNFQYYAEWWVFLRLERVLEIELYSHHHSSAHNTNKLQIWQRA